MWTALTAAFSHKDVYHLGANMVGLYFFGRDVGRLFGGKRVGMAASSPAAYAEYLSEALSDGAHGPSCLRLLPCWGSNRLSARACGPFVWLQLLMLYMAGGVAGSLAHCGWYYYQACKTGVRLGSPFTMRQRAALTKSSQRRGRSAVPQPSVDACCPAQLSSCISAAGAGEGRYGRARWFGFTPSALGASAAVNALTVCDILLYPTRTVLLYGEGCRAAAGLRQWLAAVMAWFLLAGSCSGGRLRGRKGWGGSAVHRLVLPGIALDCAALPVPPPPLTAIIPMPAALLGVLWLLNDVSGAMDGHRGHIAHAGHLGGAATGLAFFLAYK